MNNKIIFTVYLITSSLFAGAAAPVGRIAEILGAGFISQNGSTHEIKKGDLVYTNSEIVVEHQGQVTFTDNTDHRYHLGNSTSIALIKDAIELRNGDLWFQSANKNETTKIKTANAIIDFQNGEGILTYDSTKGKSQLMVINGLMKLSNSHTPDLNLSVSEGNFSYVENSYEEGAPRDPTPVGEKTYSALIGMFKGIRPMDQNSEKIFKTNEHEDGPKSHGRDIASVQEVTTAPEKHEGSHIAVKESDDSKLEEYKNSMLEKKSENHKKVLKKVKNKVYAKHVDKKSIDESYSPLVVQIFGQKKASVKESVNESMPLAAQAAPISNRAPASMTSPEFAPLEKVQKVPSTETIENEKVITKKLEKEPSIPNKETKKLLDEISNL